MNWQPIETAPKTGELILGFDPDILGICLAKWCKAYSYSTPAWYSDVATQDGLGFEDVNLTHWCKLPEPPEILK